ncbi:bile acid:sodium symporter family protein [Pollutibacter soli]|uniref:bile acid:sodium symporter family protein n=1 Tax=Pollutibacter soli TaxID=3034157 RepID=UPI0030141BE7
MEAILQKIMGVAIIIFMVGNLLEIGLRLKVSEALAAFRNLRFVILSFLWCFVSGPALAILLTKIIPLNEAYALGLVILGMSPCSPAIPVMMKKSGGSLSYMSAFMLIAYAGTVVLMPFMVPWLVKGFSADPWNIAKPLLFFITIPLIVGAVIRGVTASIADKSAPVVNKITGLNTILLVAILLCVYRADIFSAIGTYAIGTQLLFYALMGVGAYLSGFGLSYDQKAPMTLGTCTRNVGPAFAIVSVAGVPQGAITMCILAAFLGAILSGFAAAAILKRYCAHTTSAATPDKMTIDGPKNTSSISGAVNTNPQ